MAEIRLFWGRICWVSINLIEVLQPNGDLTFVFLINSHIYVTIGRSNYLSTVKDFSSNAFIDILVNLRDLKIAGNYFLLLFLLSFSCVAPNITLPPSSPRQ